MNLKPGVLLLFTFSCTPEQNQENKQEKYSIFPTEDLEIHFSSENSSAKADTLSTKIHIQDIDEGGNVGSLPPKAPGSSKEQLKLLRL